MEKKINIAELLKDCPKGTKLYSPLCGECKLDKVICKSILVESTTFKTLHFNEDGTYYEGYDDSEYLLFPSKDQRDWSKFQKTIVPKFKVGDRIKKKGSYISGVIVKMGEDNYYIEYKGGGESYVNIKAQDNWELVPDKFDISTLNPFDKVLVRDKNIEVWTANLYSHYCSNSDKPFVCIGWQTMNESSQCVPFENNEHLLGKTDDCDEYYKNW